MEEKYFEIDKRELDQEHSKEFLWDCFKNFMELVPQPDEWKGNLVLMWKEEHQRLIDNENW